MNIFDETKKIFMKNTKFVLLLLFAMVTFISCNSPEDEDVNTTTAAKTFSDIVFSKTNAYFSTTGTSTLPMDSNAAKLTVSSIDLTYINGDYSEAGFFDPIARSQEWYWDDYYAPWLSTAKEVRYYYGSTVNLQDFNAAKADQTLIDGFIAEMTIAPHAIFPEGSCIGGRQSSSPTSYLLAEGYVYGFKITPTGKSGMIYVRTDQEAAWPYWNSETKVDIIVEN